VSLPRPEQEIPIITLVNELICIIAPTIYAS
jgi:hypothetical protein